MPEFEEPEATNSSKENYTPSTDATPKPRTRRRSGGFRTEYTAPAGAAEIGEVDAAKALKSEKLSGSAKPAAEPKKERRAPKADKPAAKSESQADKPAPRISNAQPSPETLAAVARVETRINERKAERDAKRAQRDKNRPAKGDKKPAGRKSAPKQQAESEGLLASILSFFGMGAKKPAKKNDDNRKPSGNRGKDGKDGKGGKGGKGGRPPGKGSKSGNRSKGQGQNRRGGKGRRSGKGGNGQRRNDHRSKDNNA